MRNTMGGPSAGACSYTSPHVPSSPTINWGRLTSTFKISSTATVPFSIIWNVKSIVSNWPVMSCQTSGCRCSSELHLHAASGQPRGSDTAHLTPVASGHPNKLWRYFSGWHGLTPYLFYLRRNKTALKIKFSITYFLSNTLHSSACFNLNRDLVDAERFYTGSLRFCLYCAHP